MEELASTYNIAAVILGVCAAWLFARGGCLRLDVLCAGFFGYPGATRERGPLSLPNVLGTRLAVLFAISAAVFEIHGNLCSVA